MRLTDVRIRDRVRYTGSANNLVGKSGVVVGIDDKWVRIKTDDRPLATSLVRPEFLARLTGVGGVTTARREIVLPELNYRNEDERTHKLNDGARFPSNLPNGSEERKEYPVYSVLFGYFPAAMNALAHHAYKSNQKHNPGLPLQWSRDKSSDHEDCILRHLQEGDYEGVLWRAAALLQLKLEEEGAPRAPRATNTSKEVE